MRRSEAPAARAASTKFFSLIVKHLGADQADEARCERDRQRDDDVEHAGAERHQHQNAKHYGRERQQQIAELRQRHVDPPAAIAGDEPEQRADG